MKSILDKLKAIDNKEYKNLSLFSIGKFISVFGSAICTFAIGLFVLELTGSGLSFAIAVVLGFVPIIIFAPIGGVLADKFNKKTIVVAADFVNGLLFFVLYIIALVSDLNLWIIYIGAFLSASLATIFNAALESAKPNIVSDKKLLSINSVSRIIDSASSIVGPVIGGLIFAFINLRAFFLINAISFIISAIIELGINFKFNCTETPKEPVKSSFFHDIKSGVKYIKSRRDIIKILIIMLAVNFFLSFSATVPIPYIINVVFGLSSYQFGITEGAFPVGIILGALFVKKLILKIRFDKLLISASAALSICIILLAIPLFLRNIITLNDFFFVYFMILNTIFGIVVSFIDIPVAYRLQKTVSEQFRGRVLSISMSFAKVIAPVALLLSGFLLNNISTWIIVISGGVLLFVVNIIALESRKPKQNLQEIIEE